LRDGEGLSPRIPQTVRKRTEAKSKQQLEVVTIGGTPLEPVVVKRVTRDAEDISAFGA